MIEDGEKWQRLLKFANDGDENPTAKDVEFIGANNLVMTVEKLLDECGATPGMAGERGQAIGRVVFGHLLPTFVVRFVERLDELGVATERFLILKSCLRRVWNHNFLGSDERLERIVKLALIVEKLANSYQA